MFCDLNVPCTNTQSLNSNVAQILMKASELGYGAIAITYTAPESAFLKKGKKKKNNADKGENNDPFPAPCDLTMIKKKVGMKLKIYNRLNMTIKDNSELQKAFQSKNVKKFDLISVEPETPDVLKFISSYQGVNIISFNPESRHRFHIQRKLYNQLISQGIYFELLYSPVILDSTCRRHVISLAHLYHAIGKSRNIIVSSGALTPYVIRGPYDIMNLNLLFGLSEEQSKSSISYNCLRVLQEARKNSRGKCIVEMTKLANLNEVEMET